LIALRKGAMLACRAFEAGDVMVERDAVSGLELFYAAADPNDCSCRFVAENARRRHGAIMNLFYVGRADPTDRDFDQQFPGSDFWHGQSFDAQVIRAAINHRLHRLGNCRHVAA